MKGLAGYPQRHSTCKIHCERTSRSRLSAFGGKADIPIRPRTNDPNRNIVYRDAQRHRREGITLTQ
jgi:hypothetical protein